MRYQTTNPSQTEIVNLALSTNDVFLIHGPFATGKTFVLAEIIFHLLANNKKVLVACTTNTAIDNLAIKVMNSISSSSMKKSKPIRLGGISKIDRQLQNIRLLDIVFSQRQDLRERYTTYMQSDSYQEFSRNISQFEEDMKKVICETIAESNLIFTTLSNCANKLESYNLQNLQYDYLIVDEASQTILSELIIPMSISKHIILAGDHQQLLPVIKSQNDEFLYSFINQNQTEKEKYKTLFDLLINCSVSSDISRTLTIQHRMNRSLMEFSNNHFYNGILRPHFDNQSIQMNNLITNSERRDMYKHSYGLFDTEPFKFENTHDYRVYSQYNVGEALAIKFICEKIALDQNNNFKLKQVAIITPYKAQRNIIIQVLKSSDKWEEFKNIEVNTIDGYQGKENEVIIVSLVKSELDEIGFIENKKRFNVMITRAKRMMIFVGNFKGLSDNNELYRLFIDQIRSVGYDMKIIFTEDEILEIEMKYNEYLSEIDGIYDY